MKTFNQFLIDNPTFWESHSEYPVAAQNMIHDWFYYRYITFDNDITYKRYLDRKLNLTSSQFLNLYNKQIAMNFDPNQIEKIEKTINTISAVDASDIIKRILDGTVANTGTNALETAKSATNTNTKTLNVQNKTDDNTTNTTTNNLTNTLDLASTNSSKQTDTGTTGNNGKNSNTTTVLNSDYPQSTAGNFDNYLSTAKKTTVAGENSNTTTNNLETDITGSTTNTGTSKDTGTITGVVDGEVINLETGTIGDSANLTESNTSTNTLNLSLKTDNKEDTTKTSSIDSTVNIILSEIKQGNGSELFDSYFKFIKKTNAIEWLLGKIDECFLQVYDLESYEENEDAIDILQSQIDELFVTTSSLTTDVNTLNIEVDNLDTRVTYIEENGGGGTGGDVTKAYVDQQDALLASSIATTNTNVANLTTTVNSHTTSIATLNTNVANLTTTVNSHTTSIATLNTNVANLTTALNNAIADYTSKINATNSNVTINTNNIAALTTTVNNAITNFTAALTTTNDNVEINTNNIAALTTTVNNAITNFTAALTTTNDNVEINTNNIAALTTTVNNAITNFTAALTTTNDNVEALDIRVTNLESNPGGGDSVNWRIYKGIPIMDGGSYIEYRHCDLYIQGNNNDELSVYLKLYRNLAIDGEEITTNPRPSQGNGLDYRIEFNLSKSDYNNIILKNIIIPYAFTGTSFLFPNNSNAVCAKFTVDGGLTYSYRYYTPCVINPSNAVIKSGTYNDKFCLYTDAYPDTDKVLNFQITDIDYYEENKDSYFFIKLV